MSVRRVVALALSATLGITGLAAVAPSAAAASGAPYEVTIAAPPSVTPPGQEVHGAGTGVQTTDPVTRELRWQSLTDGRVERRAPCSPSATLAASGDRFGCYYAYGEQISVHDWAGGVTATRPRPEGHQLLAAFGGNRQLSFTTDAERSATLHLLGLGENAPADVVVQTTAGIKDPEVRGFDEAGALLLHRNAADAWVLGYVDFATGVFATVATPPGGAYAARAAFTADSILVYTDHGTAEGLVVSRTNPSAPGTTVKLPDDSYNSEVRLGLLGDWVVGYHGYGGQPHPLQATSLASGETISLGLTANSEVRTGPDGSLYVAGGTDSTHWGVRRATLGATGVPVTAQVLATPPLPVQRTGLTLANGRLTTENTDDVGYADLARYDLSVTDPKTAIQRWSCAVADETSPACPSFAPDAEIRSTKQWSDTGDERLVTLSAEDIRPSRGDMGCMNCVVKVHVTPTVSGGTTRTVKLDTTRRLSPQKLYGGSGRYLHFHATENYETRSVVADIETGKVLSVSNNTNQALWGSLLWTANTANDTVTAVDLRTGANVATVDLGTDCGGVFDFEVVGRWIYSLCSDSFTAFVYDREKKTSVRVLLSGRGRAHLGDGFLAYTAYASGGDSLIVTDVRSGAPVTRTLGTLPDGTVNYNQNWTIDRFGGAIAYVDSRQSIRVVGLGDATSRLAVTDSVVSAAVNLKSYTWKPRWWLSKPAASWSLALRHRATGKVVRTLTGGQARGLVAPPWDGKDAAGRYVANGAYTWTLTAKPVDGQGADLSVAGTVSVTGGAAVRRDLAGDDGFGDLLVMDTTGLVSMYRGTGTGAVSARIAGTGAKFATSSVFVPTGDLNGDRCADVYARVGDQLRAYRPGCGKVVSASSPYTVVGAGWGQYDVLTSPGDVNGDGYADLIARQASTGDVYFYGGTADHRVKPRVRIGTNWKLYKKIVGAGDLNGDGRGDLLGVDAAGVLWRYYGTATGGVTARVKVGGGWGGYSALVGVGDLSGDGRADLVARDTAGRLYAYKGTGNGLYGTRAVIGSSGWNGFKGLY
ncbi:FG-GAP-like repeat-containing protein [Streptomyces sp. NPDC053253]|uniref:FG-GAP-like repeat-containing protein n=1 Tax=Streptomyces sp. NPDC053253 TaxID=3365699 RepID=UPI0037D780AA